MTSEIPRRCWSCIEYKKALKYPLEHVQAKAKTAKVLTAHCGLKDVEIQPMCFCNEWRAE